jgi:transcriptional regulator of acetoin/glycerol metabolism
MPVFPLLKAGTFLEELYYRLNVVVLDFGARSDSSSEAASRH